MPQNKRIEQLRHKLHQRHKSTDLLNIAVELVQDDGTKLYRITDGRIVTYEEMHRIFDSIGNKSPILIIDC